MPSFAVDDGFAYEVPEKLAGLAVGDIVRVPLGGRKVRGYVTAVGDDTTDRPLRPVASRSGSRGVFNEAMLQSLRWVATHYVAPLSTVLSRCAPPNLPKRKARPAEAFDDLQLGEASDIDLEGLARRHVDKDRRERIAADNAEIDGNQVWPGHNTRQRVGTVAGVGRVDLGVRSNEFRADH